MAHVRLLFNNGNYGKPVANHYIIDDDDKLTFQSYDSTIAIFDKKEITLTLGHDWDFSTTTSRYLHVFLRTYTPFGASSRKEINKLIGEGKIIYDNNLR